MYRLARLDRQRVASFSAPIPYALPFGEEWVLSAVIVARSEPKWTSGGGGGGAVTGSSSAVAEVGQQLIQQSNPLIDSDDEALDRALSAAYPKNRSSKTKRNQQAGAKQSKYVVLTLRDLRRGPIPLVPLATQAGRTPRDEVHLLLFESDRTTKPKLDPGSSRIVPQPSEYDALMGGSGGAFEKMQTLPLGSVVALISPKIMPFRVVCCPFTT